jgi:hypothetical protein
VVANLLFFTSGEAIPNIFRGIVSRNGMQVSLPFHDEPEVTLGAGRFRSVGNRAQLLKPYNCCAAFTAPEGISS